MLRYMLRSVTTMSCVATISEPRVISYLNLQGFKMATVSFKDIKSGIRTESHNPISENNLFKQDREQCELGDIMNMSRYFLSSTADDNSKTDVRLCVDEEFIPYHCVVKQTKYNENLSLACTMQELNMRGLLFYANKCVEMVDEPMSKEDFDEIVCNALLREYKITLTPAELQTIFEMSVLNTQYNTLAYKCETFEDKIMIVFSQNGLLKSIHVKPVKTEGFVSI